AAADGVHHDVDPPEALDDLADQALRVILKGHAGRDREGLRPDGPRPRCHRLERLAAPARDRDARPGGGKRFGDGGSQPASTTVHERDPSGEAEPVEAVGQPPSPPWQWSVYCPTTIDHLPDQR